MKFFKLFSLLVITLLSLNVYANPATTLTQVVFFGDSLTDNGNLFSADFNTLPLPPYFNGRFTNGPTWADIFKNNFAASHNYAFGGETANYYASDSYLNVDLDDTLAWYYLDYPGHISHTLFVIWIGSNDYFRGDMSDVDALSSYTVNKIKTDIDCLIGQGAKYFLVINLPDLGASPSAISSGAGPLLTGAALLHNEKLKTAIQAIQNSNSNVKINIFDVNTLFATLVSNPDKYNKKYGTHITNFTDPCWTGAYSLQAAALREDEMAKQLEKNYNANISHGVKAAKEPINFKAMAHHIAANRDLTAAYLTSQNNAKGLKPCADPDSYLFWDNVHPTKVVHEILAQEITSYVQQLAW